MKCIIKQIMGPIFDVLFLEEISEDRKFIKITLENGSKLILETATILDHQTNLKNKRGKKEAKKGYFVRTISTGDIDKLIIKKDFEYEYIIQKTSFTLNCIESMKLQNITMGCTNVGSSVIMEGLINKLNQGDSKCILLNPGEENDKEYFSLREHKIKEEHLNHLNYFYKSLDNKDLKNVFHDAIFDIFDIEPNEKQIKEVFLCIDSYTFGQAISFGFSDTVVREHIHEFLNNESEKIKKIL